MQKYTPHILFERISLSDDEGALSELHELYFYRLYKLCYSIIGNKEAAEEITSDVFINIWQKRHLLPKISNPELYLLKCARNKAFGYLRKPRHETSEEDLHDFSVEWDISPEQILISSEMVRHINAAINSLPPKCKLIFLFVKEGDLKYREVAELLNLSVKTVETQMRIALKKIGNSVPFSFPHQ
ncbi:MAG TPA: RNA polymerase sigma-70 factor [Puia sp.]|nr:RNA polymerase sigma-70 factor [Puia sp.]